jgi:uncharacterized protein (TIGR02594 family)
MPLPLWYTIAEHEMGTKEVPGSTDNPRIVEYHSATTLKATDDETPWCSSFVNWCLKQAGVIGTNSAAAISFLTWGRELKEPTPGCIVVFSHHVGFFAGYLGQYVIILGGNQSNKVKLSNYPAKDILAFRCPNG